MKTYAMADESVTDLVAEILSKHYPEHLALRLKVDVLMVSTDEEVSALIQDGPVEATRRGGAIYPYHEVILSPAIGEALNR